MQERLSDIAFIASREFRAPQIHYFLSSAEISIKITLKKRCCYQKYTDTHVCAHIIEARYRLCHIQCLLSTIIFSIISSHTNTLPRHPLALHCAGKYMYSARRMYMPGGGGRRDRRVYINMAKLNTKGGNVARQPGYAHKVEKNFL